MMMMMMMMMMMVVVIGLQLSQSLALLSRVPLWSLPGVKLSHFYVVKFKCTMKSLENWIYLSRKIAQKPRICSLKSFPDCTLVGTGEGIPLSTPYTLGVSILIPLVLGLSHLISGRNPRWWWWWWWWWWCCYYPSHISTEDGLIGSSVRASYVFSFYFLLTI